MFPRQDAELVDKIRKAVRQRTRLTRARARDDADIPLRRRDGLVLRAVQSRKQMLHALSPPLCKFLNGGIIARF